MAHGKVVNAGEVTGIHVKSESGVKA